MSETTTYKLATTAEQLMDGLLTVIRNQFYEGKGDRRFYQQQAILKRALVYPAKLLAAKGVSLPVDEYEKLILECLKGVKVHAAGDVAYFGGYFLKVVQEHMRVQWEKYYNAGVSIRSQAGSVLADLEARQRPVAQLAAMPVTSKQHQAAAIAAELAALPARLADGGRLLPELEAMSVRLKARPGGVNWKVSPRSLLRAWYAYRDANSLPNP